MNKLLIAWIILLLCSCSDTNSRRLAYALDLAGENRTELETVLAHYKDDPEKLEAARFLIRNMPYHYSKDEYYLSLDGKRYRPEIASFKGSIELKKHCDSLMRQGYRAEQRNVYDITSLDSAFVVNNIDLAFLVWRKPWAKNVSFTDFCKYILPYRAQIEKTSSLRQTMMERFIPLLDSAKVTTPLEACMLLNKQLKEVIKYRNTGLSFYPTIDETYRAGISQCDGICNLGMFIMRSVGIPVAVDFTTWVKMDLGHTWCAVLDGGRFYSFGPGEDQPDIHAKMFSKIRNRRPAKVYRSQFDLPNLTKNQKDDGYRTYLKSPLLRDVTGEYLDKPIRIAVSVDENENIKGKKNNQVYLCVHNFFEWKPLAIGQRTDDICVFDNVVGDNIFIVADYSKEKEFRYLTAPFYISKTGAVNKFIPRMNDVKSFTLTKRKNWPNVEHTLSYWDTAKQCFSPLSYTEATESTQIYKQIPANALLHFTIPKRILNQRVFFIENDRLKSY